MNEPHLPGRPRSERAHRAVLQATAELLESVGYDKLTIEAIAERASVGRQTIYRWWRTKSSIIAEAVLEGDIAVPGSLPVGADGSEPDLLSWFTMWTSVLRVPANASLIRALAAAAASDPVNSHALYEFATRQAHDTLLATLIRNRESGFVRMDIDLDAAADALLGAVLYRVLARLDLPADLERRLLKPLLVDQSDAPPFTKR